MRNLTELELEIVEKKNERMKTALVVTGVEYKKLFPRTILCLLTIENATYYGIAMRARNDMDVPLVGELISFTRAINEAAQNEW